MGWVEELGVIVWFGSIPILRGPSHPARYFHKSLLSIALFQRQYEQRTQLMDKNGNNKYCDLPQHNFRIYFSV